MGLTLKDGISTLFAALIGFITYYQIKGLHFIIIFDVRLASLALIIIGALMCAYGKKTVYPAPTSDPILVVESILGFVALTIGILGIITGNIIMLVIQAGIILFLWLLSVVGHLFSR